MSAFKAAFGGSLIVLGIKGRREKSIAPIWGELLWASFEERGSVKSVGIFPGRTPASYETLFYDIVDKQRIVSTYNLLMIINTP